MVRKYRSSWEIILDILASCADSGGVKKTHIMYRANLNYLSFNKFFPSLVKEGYITELPDPDGGVFYKLTKKGKVLLEILREAKQNIPHRKLRQAFNS